MDIVKSIKTVAPEAAETDQPGTSESGPETGIYGNMINAEPARANKPAISAPTVTGVGQMSGKQNHANYGTNKAETGSKTVKE